MVSRRGMTSGRRSGAGFTLMELIIALAMVGLITLLLFSGLRIGSRTWEGLDAVAARTDDLRLADGFLSRTLAQARPATVVYDGEQRQVFAGDAERIDFAAPLSQHVGVPGIYILRLALEGSGERRELVLTRWLIHPEIWEGDSEIPPWEPLDDVDGSGLDGIPLDADAAGGAFGRTLLLDGVSGLQIDYFGALEGDLEPDWHEEWLDQRAMPLLVRIHLDTPDQSWPDIIVSLPLLRT